MTELNQIYRCKVCGNIIEVIHAGKGQLVCCGEPMQLQEEKKNETGQEKHVPVIKVNEINGKVVKVGMIPHPMEENHFIEWIELITTHGSYRKFLEPGQIPEMKVNIENLIKVRSYCNVHGLWTSN